MIELTTIFCHINGLMVSISQIQFSVHILDDYKTKIIIKITCKLWFYENVFLNILYIYIYIVYNNVVLYVCLLLFPSFFDYESWIAYGQTN